MQPSQGDVRRLHRLPYHPYQLAIQRIKVSLLTQVHGEAGEEGEPTSGLEPLTPALVTSLLLQGPPSTATSAKPIDKPISSCGEKREVRLVSPRLPPVFLPQEFWVMASCLKLAMKSLLSDR